MVLTKRFRQNSYLKAISLGATLTILASCATGPSFKEYSDQLSELPEDKARLYIYRPENRASSIKPDIRLDDKIIGQSEVKEFTVVDIDSGVHTLTTSNDSRVKYIFYLKKGEEHYIRLEVKRGFAVNKVDSVSVAVDVGLAEIVNTTYAEK